MTEGKQVSEHYSHGNLLEAIEDALSKLGKSPKNVTIHDLAPVDEFHIGGRQATERFLKQLEFPQKGHILDVGCGLGGAARFVADMFDHLVSGIDLTKEYIDTGNALCAWVGLDNHITLHEGSALSMPFESETFDGAYMMHVGMNIKDKEGLFKEVYRVLKPGAVFGVYDVMRDSAGELAYPVPWATDSSTSHLGTPSEYSQALGEMGFEVLEINNRIDFAMEFFRQLKEKTEDAESTPPLGLHTLMQKTTAEKVKNMIDNITNGIIAPVEIVAKKV